MDVTVVVPSTDLQWRRLAQNRAIPSAKRLGLPVVEGLGPTVMDARNNGLDQVTTEWVLHLDADDELEPGYVKAMAQGRADVRAPSVRYVNERTPNAWERVVPYVPRVAGHSHDCAGDCLPYGNWLVIGSVVRTELVHRVGGWRDYDWSEDWDLWLRCHLAGATIEAIPSAIYRAYVRRNSRNRGASRATRLASHRAIATANGVPSP